MPSRIAIVNPYLAGGLFVDYLVRGRYHLIPKDPQVCGARQSIRIDSPTAPRTISQVPRSPRLVRHRDPAPVSRPATDSGSTAMTRTSAGANSGLKGTGSTMSKSEPQSFKNHGRFDPPYHFFLTWIFLANVIISIVYAVHHLCFYSVWLVVLSIAAFLLRLQDAPYPLKVQDRVIRLEERLRLQALAPEEWHTQIYRLTEDQLIGLRFAADDEVVELAKQALEHNLNRKQIKERIKDWRPDNWRV